MNNGPITLKFGTEVQSQYNNAYIWGEYGIYMVKLGQLRANMPK